MGKVRKKLKLHVKVKRDITRSLQVGSTLTCADNTGAKILKIITVAGYKTRKRQRANAGVSDLTICSVVAGKPDVKGEIVNAIIIRQRKEYRRPEGTRIKFSDNAAVVVTPDGELKGTDIRGPVARESTQRWSGIASAAKIVV